MKTSIMRRSRKIALAFGAVLAIGTAIAAAPGPTSNGEFFYYFDSAGKTIGYRAIDCNGNFSGWGKTSTRYADGYMLCLPNND
jgi:Family of unknown function (DUF6289)